LYLNQQNENCQAWINKGTGKFADSFLILRIAGTGDLFVIFIQSKGAVVSRKQKMDGKTPNNIPSRETVDKEHTKVRNGLGMNINYVFVYITDHKALSSEKSVLQPNEILITIDEHEAFFGNMVAFRRLSSVVIK